MIRVKAMEAVKSLDVQPRRTPRRKRTRNVQKVAAGAGEALPGPAVREDAPPEASRPLDRVHAGKWAGSRKGARGGRTAA